MDNHPDRPHTSFRTTFIGRDPDLAVIRAHLTETRLITLLGPAGIGKTRLALEAAARWAGPVHICDLDGCTDPDQVPAAVANAFGFPTLPAAIIGQTGRTGLLVLDNCEHLLEAAADAAEELLRRCPGLSILATSRERLAIPGEHLQPVRPLSTATDPGSTLSDAALLFVDRAANLGTGRSSAVADVERLCRALDGIPLAVELAAARAGSLGPAELALVLVSSPRDLSGRHGAHGQRSAAVAVEWSVGRLTPELRRRFSRLGVFEQAFSLESAHGASAGPDETLPTTINALRQLVELSLVSTQREGDRTWYRMLPVVRGRARGQLQASGEYQAVAGRVVDLMVEHSRELAEQNRTAWTRELTRLAELLHDDLADALRCAVRSDESGERAFPLLTALWSAVAQGHADATVRLGRAALRRFPEPSPARSDAAAVTAWAGLVNADAPTALRAAEEALGGPASAFARVLAHQVLHQVARCSGDPEGAVRELHAALDVADAAGLQPWRVELALRVAEAQATRGDRPQARSVIAAATADWPDLPPSLAARAAALSATLDHLDGIPAERGFVVAEALARSSDEASVLGETMRVAGAAAVLRGEIPAAAATLREALDALLSAGRQDLLPTALRWIAGLLVAARQPVTAAMVLGGIDTNCTDTLDPLEAPLAEMLRAIQPAPGMALLASLELARRSADQLSVSVTAHRQDSTRGGAVTDVASLVRQGPVWRLRYADTEITLATSTGLEDLAELLRNPGRAIPSAELIGSAPAPGGARLQDRVDAAVGVAERRRRSGSSLDRATSAVAWRIRAAVERIANADPVLGAHLRASVHTGVTCRYEPASPVLWRMQADLAAADPHVRLSS